MTSYTTAQATVWGKGFKFTERPEPLSAVDRPTPRKWKKCPTCRRLFPAWRRKHVWRCCDDYADLWAGDQRMRLFGAMKAYDGESVRMVTVTAPGSDLLPWSDRCAALGKHRHSGALGCGVDPDIGRSWNERASHRWTSLHQAACRHIRHSEMKPPRVLVKAWEYQRRGVLHLHLVFGVSSPQDAVAVDAYVTYLSENSGRAYFGFVDRKEQVQEPTAAAAYLSSYFVGGKGGKLDIRETVKREDVPPNVIYVAPHLLQASGLSMRSLRLRRYLYWQIGVGGLRLVQLLGLSLEDVYELHKRGWWGKTLTNMMVSGEVCMT